MLTQVLCTSNHEALSSSILIAGVNALRNSYDMLNITMDNLDQILALSLFILRNRTGMLIGSLLLLVWCVSSPTPSTQCAHTPSKLSFVITLLTQFLLSLPHTHKHTPHTLTIDDFEVVREVVSFLCHIPPSLLPSSPFTPTPTPSLSPSPSPPSSSTIDDFEVVREVVTFLCHIAVWQAPHMLTTELSEVLVNIISMSGRYIYG